jgi:nucleotide-binding universal stress UspA family protein
MLVDLSVLFRGTEALIVAVTMSVVATASKWIAAWATQKTFRMPKIDRQIIFGLSNGQAAATLAAVLIGYNIIIGTSPEGEPIRLLDENILNGTIIMILVTCTISSIVTESAARQLALNPTSTPTQAAASEELEERVLIPVANPATIDNLVNLALLMKDSKKRTPLYALSVSVDRADERDNVSRQELLPKVAKLASAVDTPVNMISRYDVNIASGIVHTIKENNITDIVVGFHHKANIADVLFGPTTQNILKRTNKMMLIVKSLTPINSINKLIVCVPAKAEYETGFVRWVDRIANMATQLSCMVVFHSNPSTERELDNLISAKRYRFRMRFEAPIEWDNFSGAAETIEQHDMLVIISARHTSISYNSVFDKLPEILAGKFANANLLVIYPEQFDNHAEATFFIDPQAVDIEKNYFNLTPAPLQKLLRGKETDSEAKDGSMNAFFTVFEKKICELLWQ